MWPSLRGHRRYKFGSHCSGISGTSKNGTVRQTPSPTNPFFANIRTGENQETSAQPDTDIDPHAFNFGQNSTGLCHGGLPPDSSLPRHVPNALRSALPALRSIPGNMYLATTSACCAGRGPHGPLAVAAGGFLHASFTTGESVQVETLQNRY